jgi:hypothetical protein
VKEQAPLVDEHDSCRRQIYELQRRLAERTGMVAQVLQGDLSGYKALAVERVVITEKGLVVYVR